MARKVFLSFHYQLDHWRVNQVRNIGAIEEQPVLTAQEWEDVAKGGDAAIEKWIDDQMKGKSCNVVLIGSQTAGRKWVQYEFRKAWKEGKGVVGIYIHGLEDQNGKTSSKGKNPFSGFTLKNGTVPFDSVVPVHNPAGSTSNQVYASISNNIDSWVADAIRVRQSW